MSTEKALLVLVLSGVVLYLLWDTYFMQERVRSRVDGRTYLVQGLLDKQDAADLLANIRINLENVNGHLAKTAPDDERTKRIQANFRSGRICESAKNAKYTSYSINKGQKIVFCLRSQDGTLTDLNTMMFVALHELAHVGSAAVGHTPEFWANFAWLLEEAVQIGLYRRQDFTLSPVPYCGIMITNTQLNRGSAPVAKGRRRGGRRVVEQPRGT